MARRVARVGFAGIGARPAKINPRTNQFEEKRYRTMACKKVVELTMKHGLPVKADWAACKYYEEVRK